MSKSKKTTTAIVILLADKNLIRGAIQAANHSNKMTVALKQACELVINENSIPAKKAIEGFGHAIGHNKDARKKYTAQLSLASKKVRKANGIENPCGLKIDKNGLLVDAPMRNTGGNGGGGEGESSQMVASAAAPEQPTINGEALKHLRAMFEASKCVEDRAALKIAIAAIAASM